jgi:hypothetical protein
MRFVVLALLLVPCAVQADPLSATAITTCGTPPLAYTSGQANSLTQNTVGRLCVETTCSAPPLVYVAGQSYPVLIDTNGKLCTSGG